MEILFELCDVSSKCITSWEMTAEKYSRCQFGFILHLCTCSYLLLKVCLSQFWREVFFSSLPHLAMRKRWNCGCDSWVWCKPGGSPAVWDGDGCGCSECLGGCFFSLGPGNGPAVPSEMSALPSNSVDGISSCLAGLHCLKTKGMLLLVFFNPHFCLIPVCIPFSQFLWSSFHRNREFYFLIPWDAAGNYYYWGTE